MVGQARRPPVFGQSAKGNFESHRSPAVQLCPIPWTDVCLDAPLDGYSDKPGWINTTLNWEIGRRSHSGLQRALQVQVSTLEVFDAIVAYAKQIDLKVN